MSYIFNTFFYNPLYNALVFIIDFSPNHDAGIGVVLLTVVVSLLLFSISKKAIKTQIKLKEIQPELDRIKTDYTDRQKQAEAMLALYRKHDVNPFSLIFFVLLQIPILFALYWVFLKGGLPNIHTEVLYGFIKVPEAVSMSFLGLLDISQKSLVMAVIAGVTQFIQAQVATPKTLPNNKPISERTFGEDFQRSLHMQIRYVFPVIIGIISATLPSALALYWATRNIFMTVQEVFVKKSLKK